MPEGKMGNPFQKLSCKDLDYMKHTQTQYVSYVVWYSLPYFFLGLSSAERFSVLLNNRFTELIDQSDWTFFSIF